MSKVSIIIPSRNEKWLARTIQDVLEKATGDYEILVGLDGKTDYQLVDHQKVSYLESFESIGLKPMINKLARAATGKYIYKSDSHCMFGEGFDEILQQNMEDNWVVTPRFYVLDAEKWEVQDQRFYDYFYLSCPFTDRKGIRFKAGGHWPERTKERLLSHPTVDETPQMHGSGWFVNRDFFLNEIGGFPESDPFGHAQEPPYLGLKMWLGLGKLMVNKQTWYAHLHQDGNKRGYKEDRSHTERTYREVADHWLMNKWEKFIGGRRYDFEYFVDKFMPMPGWPENWRDLYAEYLRLHSK